MDIKQTVSTKLFDFISNRQGLFYTFIKLWKFKCLNADALDITDTIIQRPKVLILIYEKYVKYASLIRVHEIIKLYWFMAIYISTQNIINNVIFFKHICLSTKK